MRRTLFFILFGLLGLTQINCAPKAAPMSPAAPGANSSYSFITNFGQVGYTSSGPYFSDIRGIAVSGNKVFVGDSYHPNVEVYDLNGNFLTNF
jgi:hypothetical protein